MLDNKEIDKVKREREREREKRERRNRKLSVIVGRIK